MDRWDTSVAEAVALQRELASRVVSRNGFDPGTLKTIAGVDASYKDVSTAAVVVLCFPDLQVIEEAVATRETTFPYIPGLLSFREIPVLLDALAKLRTTPELLVVDGHGVAHPRRIGIASHLGVVTGMPAIGCAKSRLTGVFEEPGPLAGDCSPLTSRGGDVLGRVVRTKPRTRPLFISIGHKSGPADRGGDCAALYARLSTARAHTVGRSPVEAAARPEHRRHAGRYLTSGNTDRNSSVPARCIIS